MIRRSVFLCVVVFLSCCILELLLHFVMGNMGILELFCIVDEPKPMIDLRPNFEIVHSGVLWRSPPVHYRVNAYGYRGTGRPPQKDTGVFRIISVGDSNTFGHGVTEGKDYPSRLETLLNHSGGSRVEVLNFGVDGLNFQDILDRARLRALPFHPNLFLIQIEDNDYDPPAYRIMNFLTQGMVWSLRHIYLSTLVHKFAHVF